MNRTIDDVKKDMIDCVIAHIDCMNDFDTPQEAMRLVNKYVEHMNPLLEEYFEIRQLRQHLPLQQWLQFETEEELEARKRRLRIRPGREVIKEYRERQKTDK